MTAFALKEKLQGYEIMAPVGSRESLGVAFKAEADSITQSLTVNYWNLWKRKLQGETLTSSLKKNGKPLSRYRNCQEHIYYCRNGLHALFLRVQGRVLFHGQNLNTIWCYGWCELESDTGKPRRAWKQKVSRTYLVYGNGVECRTQGKK